MRFPRHLARTLTSCADARYVGDNLVVANALGVDHPELGDRERYVLDVRNPWSDDDAERVVRRPVPHVHVTEIPVRDGGTVPREAAMRAVAWYERVRAEHPDVLVVVNCLMGASRSATVAYAFLRRCHGLDHAEAFRRVATRAHKATDTLFWPSEETLSDVRAWCDAVESNVNIPSNLRVGCPVCGASLAPTIGRTLPLHQRIVFCYDDVNIVAPCDGGRMDVTCAIADAIVRDADHQVADIRDRIEKRNMARDEYAAEQRALAEQRIAQYDAETASRRQVLIDAERSAREARAIAESLRRAT